MLLRSILPITRYKTRKYAEKAAICFRAEDKEWTYVVEPSGDAFVVVAYDEFGNKLGAM